MLFGVRSVKLCFGLILGLILSLCFMATSAEAHRPVFPDGLNVSANSAFQLDDIDISQAIYQVLNENEQLWLSFHPERSNTKIAIIQLGIPVLEETKSFRPKIALLSPELKKIDLPFETPAEFGAIVYDSDDMGSIREFHEPFTNTNSWILIEEQFEIVGNGIHYVVIFSDSNQSGKFWFATGTREVFDFSSGSELAENASKVKEFHLPSISSFNAITVSSKENPGQLVNEIEFEDDKIDADARNYFKSANGYLTLGLAALISSLVFARRRFNK